MCIHVIRAGEEIKQNRIKITWDNSGFDFLNNQIRNVHLT